MSAPSLVDSSTHAPKEKKRMGKFTLGFVAGIAALVGGIAVLAVLEDERDEYGSRELYP